MIPSLSFSSLVPYVSSLTLALASYAPVSTPCPSGSLVRDASGLSDSEETYRVARKAIADVNLKSWLLEQDSGFGTDNLPTVALTTSGGGYRSLLTGAGVVQGLDSRDSNISTSGLLQALTYQAGLSGGAWLLSSFAGNNYPTISNLRDNLWKEAFRDSLLDPEFLLAADAYADIVRDIADKDAAGFSPALTDIWGRLLSYQLLEGTDGGVGTTLSSVTSLSNFTNHAVPFPIITSLGVKTFEGDCTPGPNATQYEFSPYEFGSWDRDVSAFTFTNLLGTTVSNGTASTATCTTNYDNLGYVLGTSSTLFNELCGDVPTPENATGSDFTSLVQDLEELLLQVHEFATEDEYAIYPNPFFNYASSTGVVNPANDIAAQTELHLVDGGEALQNNPLWPLLQPSRNVSAIIVNDNSADTSNNFPNGSEILTTYVQSLTAGLTRMPVIPSVDTFISEGLNARATFFGCNDTSKITIIYLPNVNYTFDSGIATAQFVYSEDTTTAMISNGQAVAAQNGTEGWGTCLGCALMMKEGGALPSACTDCFSKYCYSS